MRVVFKKYPTIKGVGRGLAQTVLKTFRAKYRFSHRRSRGELSHYSDNRKYPL
jgi:hypothetical protein